MNSLPWPARIYILVLTALATSAVFFSSLAVSTDLSTWVVVSIIAVAIALLDAAPIAVYGEEVEITISNSVKFAAILLYPPPVVILSTCVGTVFGELLVKRMWFKKVFNVSEMVLVWTLVAWFYQQLNQPTLDYFDSPQNIAAVVLAGLSDYAINSLLISTIISLAAKMPLRYILAKNSFRVIWYELSIIPLGTFLAVLWRFNHLSILLAALPLLLVRQSLKIANDLQRQTEEALRALVRVIDERDHHTFDHSERVSNYARLTAEALDLRPEDVEIITPAALVHDLGKVGMADDVLFNPNSLNADERKHAQRHAEIGAMLLAKFPLFQKGSTLVRYHHERFDGKGYPEGLKGEQIPIGSRIISIADAFQAMTEQRPYRRALSPEEAIAQLVAERGGQFDPKVVDAFLVVVRAELAKDKSAKT